MKNSKIVLLAVSLFLLLASQAFAAPTTSQQAASVVKGWLDLGDAPFGKPAGGFERVESWDADGPAVGEALYHIVYLKPKGIVILPGDDLLEPISVYVAEATTFGEEKGDPLKEVLAGSIARAVEELRTALGGARGVNSNKASEKWRSLADGSLTASTRGDDEGLSMDYRVRPLVKSKWNQLEVGPDETFYVFNYYTPNHYPSGCSTTATSQVMRYFEYPKNGIGRRLFTINVDGKDVSAKSIGGDGSGGPYRWDMMPLEPDVSMPEEERQAIGALLHDVGASLQSRYTVDGTGAMTFEAADRLMDTFGYANAAAMRTDAGIPADAMYRALNSNLDAGCPTILSIFGFKRSDAHAIVCDGYAYQYGTAYHHVNMGWGGRRDAWYVLPIIEILNDKDELAFTYTSLYGIVYNIFPEGGHGEIVSGRVLDKEGSPVAGAEVYMVGGSYSKTAKSNESGIFAFKNVPSNTTLTLSATLGNRRFTAHGTARTGKSSLVDADSETWYEFDLGNVWGVELSETDYVYSGGGSGCSATSGLFVLVLAASALIYRRR